MTPPLKIIYVTCPTIEAAQGIAEKLVTENLVACVNILPISLSIYRWEGKICREPEVLMIIKTLDSQVGSVENRLNSLHPYSTPEFIVLAPEYVSSKYLAWITG